MYRAPKLHWYFGYYYHFKYYSSYSEKLCVTSIFLSPLNARLASALGRLSSSLTLVRCLRRPFPSWYLLSFVNFWTRRMWLGGLNVSFISCQLLLEWCFVLPILHESPLSRCPPSSLSLAVVDFSEVLLRHSTRSIAVVRHDSDACGGGDINPSSLSGLGTV